MNFSILLPILIPFAALPLIAAAGRAPNLRETATLLAGLLTFASLLALAANGTGETFILFSFFSGLDFAFTPEPLGLLFALLASGLWIVNSIYAVGYMRANQHKRQTRFYLCFAIAIGSAVGIALSANLITFFVFYEILTLSTWPLVIHKETPNAIRAGRTYLALLLGTSFSLLLPAIVWTYLRAGTLTFTAGGILADRILHWEAAILLALFVFGTAKAALMPLHRWLPAAMVAPTPVSALLHAVAVVKAGVFALLKIGFFIFGSSFLLSSGASQWLIWLASFSIVAASAIALSKDNLKARLAFSTVSQLAYVTLALAIATPAAFMAGAFHIIAHAFAKITLFFCAGAITTATGKTEVSQMAGLGRAMPLTFAAFFIASLSLIGLPPLAGFWTKWSLFSAAETQGAWIALVALMASSLFNIAYLLPIPLRAFFDKPSSPPPSANAPLSCRLALCFTAAACVLLFFLAAEARDVFNFTNPAAQP